MEELDRRIASNPCATSAIFARSEIRRTQGDLALALAEIGKAGDCPEGDPGDADVARGALLLSAKLPKAALAAAERALQKAPDRTEARLLRGRALVALHRFAPGASDLAKAIGKLRTPQPDQYLEVARAYEKAGDVALALSALDGGISTLGPLSSLGREAVRIATEAKRYEVALLYLALLAERTPPRESWLLLRGKVFAQAQRTEEAHRAYTEALLAFQARPHRTKAVLAMEAEARAALAGLQRSKTPKKAPFVTKEGPP